MGGEQRKEGWREQKARLRNRLSGQLEGRMQVEDLTVQCWKRGSRIIFR